MGNSIKSAAFLIESRLADAERGDPNAYFDLGIAHSSGADGREVDFVQAHKWFNHAALAGSEEGQACRAELSEEMAAREIAEAQRQARAWLYDIGRNAASQYSLRIRTLIQHVRRLFCNCKGVLKGKRWSLCVYLRCHQIIKKKT